MKFIARQVDVQIHTKGGYVLSCPKCGDMITANCICEAMQYCTWCGQKIEYEGVRAKVEGTQNTDSKT